MGSSGVGVAAIDLEGCACTGACTEREAMAPVGGSGCGRSCCCASYRDHDTVPAVRLRHGQNFAKKEADGIVWGKH